MEGGVVGRQLETDSVATGDDVWVGGKSVGDLALGEWLISVLCVGCCPGQDVVANVEDVFRASDGRPR